MHWVAQRFSPVRCWAWPTAAWVSE